jgi:WD40 repeat protein
MFPRGRALVAEDLFHGPRRIVNGQLVHDGRACLVDADNLDVDTFAAEFQDGTIHGVDACSPLIYRIKAGGTVAEKFFDASSEGPGTFFFGIMVDAPNNTVWACQLTPVPATEPALRKSKLRSFDLETGDAKTSWSLHGDSNTCNDLTFGPDHSLYISDTANGRIYKMAPAPRPPIFS